MNIKEICDRMEKEGMDQDEWKSISPLDQKDIVTELIERNKSQSYNTRADVYNRTLGGFKYNPETMSFQDEKTWHKFEVDQQNDEAEKNYERHKDDDRRL